MAVRRNPNKSHTFATSITTVKNCFEMLALTVAQLRLPHLRLDIASSGLKVFTHGPKQQCGTYQLLSPYMQWKIIIATVYWALSVYHALYVYDMYYVVKI